MHAEQCPVCKSSGKYEEKECHGCNGKGWVTVTDNQSISATYIPYIAPYQPLMPCGPDIEPEPYYPYWQYPVTTGDYIYPTETIEQPKIDYIYSQMPGCSDEIWGMDYKVI